VKNPKQDDAVERMLSELEGLLKRQQDSARASRRVDEPGNDDSYARQRADQRHSGDGDLQRFAPDIPARLHDRLGGNGGSDAPPIGALGYDPDATAPDVEPYDPDAVAPNMEPYDPDATAIEMDAFDPDIRPPEIDAYDPEIIDRPLDAYEVDPALPDPDAGVVTVATGAEAVTPRPSIGPQYELTPEPQFELTPEPEAEADEMPQPEAQPEPQALQPEAQALQPEPLPLQPDPPPEALASEPDPQPEPPASQQAEGAHMTRRLTTRLGQLLVDAGLLSESQLENALQRQQETGQRLGALLVNDGFIDEPTLLSVLADQYGVPAAGLDEITFDAALAKLIPHDMARRYLLVPLALRADAVDVAMVDPTDFVAMAHVRFATGLRPNVFITTVTAAQRAIAKLYAGEDAAAGEQPRDPRNEIKRMILDRDNMLIAADQDPRKFYELAATIDAFVDEIFRKASGSG